jgi:hypothetical protein
MCLNSELNHLLEYWPVSYWVEEEVSTGWGPLVWRVTSNTRYHPDQECGRPNTDHRLPTTLRGFFWVDAMLRFLAHHELFYPSHSSRGLCVNCDKALRIVVQRGTPHPKPEGARWTGIRWFRMMNYFTGYQGRRPLKLQARVEASSPLLIIAIEDPWFGRVSEWASERAKEEYYPGMLYQTLITK